MKTTGPHTASLPSGLPPPWRSAISGGCGSDSHGLQLPQGALMFSHSSFDTIGGVQHAPKVVQAKLQMKLSGRRSGAGRRPPGHQKTLGQLQHCTGKSQDLN